LTSNSNYSTVFVVEIDKSKKLTFKKIKDFQPEILVETEDDTEWKDLITKKPLRKITFSDVQSFHEYRNKYKDHMMLYNNIDVNYQYIRKHQSEDVIIPRLWNFDIETGRGKEGFSDPRNPDAPITLIQITDSDGNDIIFGWMMDYKDDGLTYIKCENEKDMLMKFRDLYLSSNVIHMSAWFGRSYDYPYIVNRCKVHGISISSFSHFRATRTVNGYIGKEKYEYEVPIESEWLDTVDVYKSLIPGGRESWSLNFIANYHGIEAKLNFQELGFKSILELIEGKYDPKYDVEKNSELYHAFKNDDKEKVKQLSYNILVEYGRRDTKVLYELEKKLNFLPILISVGHMMGINGEDALSTIKPWEIYIYKYIYDKKLAIQHKSNIDFIPFAGGFVYAKPGRYKWVVVADYSALYPSIQIECNISPDTFVHPSQVSKELQDLTRDMFENQETCEDIYISKSAEEKKRIYELCVEENLVLGINGVFYTKDFQGILPMMLEEVAEKRNVEKKNIHKYEEMLQQEDVDKLEISDKLVKSDLASKTYKKTSNSEYGAIGNKVLCIANPYVASSITSYGRFSIKTTSKYVSKKINDKYNLNIYTNQIDTDSFFKSLQSLVDLRFKNSEPSNDEVIDFLIEFVTRYMNPVIDESSQRNKKIVNAYKDFLKMDIEVISSTMISTGKKRYAMTVDVKDLIKLAKPSKKITGIEIKRSSSPSIIRNKLEESLDILFFKENDDLIDFIEEFKKDYLNMKYNIDEVAIPTGVSDISKYETPQRSTPIHVRAALVHNLYFKDNKNVQSIINGDKIKWCYLKDGNPFNSNVIGWNDIDVFEDIDLYKYVDLHIMFDKTFMSPLRKLLDAIGWNEVRLSKGTSLF
jgi:DNA polymerase elongation subunit (family B)